MMTSKLYDKCTNIINEDGSRSYICRDYTNKMTSNLHHFRQDGRFCDIDLISGDIRVKVSNFEYNFIDILIIFEP